MHTSSVLVGTLCGVQSLASPQLPLEELHVFVHACALATDTTRQKMVEIQSASKRVRVKWKPFVVVAARRSDTL
jgi:hypothetical protein